MKEERLNIAHKNKERVGERHINNYGCGFTIVDYRAHADCDIEFDSGAIIKNTTYTVIKKGLVKDPYNPSVYDIGFEGVGKYSRKTHFIIYKKWTNMIRRSYSKNYSVDKPTYKDVVVCEEWHCFQNFGAWFENTFKEHMYENWHLDKDILVKENKTYSPEACCFVPIEINGLFVKRKANRGEYPIGITKIRDKFIVQCSVRGESVFSKCYPTVAEAFNFYKITKEEYIKEVANEWRELIDERVYQALINYKVEITD